MNIEFDKAFEKSLDRSIIKSRYPKILKIVIQCTNAPSLSDIPNVRKLSGYKTYYRIRLGEYRIGFETINKETIRFILIAHRKDIYKSFPK